MILNQPHVTRIPPVPEPPARPLWSVMIPTFNCGRFLPQAIASVLAQAPSPDTMQIEVIDDHSTVDDPEKIAEEVGGGRVGFFRQSANVGHTKNFETCLQRARGGLVHLLHGDDYVLKGFYGAMERAFAEIPEAGAAFCRSVLVDEQGHQHSFTSCLQDNSSLLQDALLHLAAEQHIMTPSIVVRRAVYEDLGAFDERLVCAEDWEMWVRIAAHYPVWFEPQPLAVYRMHRDSNSGRHVRTGEGIRHIHLAIDIMASHLPGSVAETLSRRAKQTYARSAFDTALALLKQRDFTGGMAVAKEAFRLSRSPRVFLYAAQRSAKMLLS
jgi:glycosyltransferase involved in cell wall biosynthesis